MNRRAVVLFACLSSCVPLASLYAADGDVDPSFGTAGSAKATLPGVLSPTGAFALQSDGKVLTAYVDTMGLRITRYDASGTLDPAFGVGGVVTTAAPGSAVRRLAIDSNGKLLIVVATPALVIARYDANGNPDGSFGSGGIATPPDCGTEQGSGDLVVQADGKLVLANASREAPSDYHSCLVRFDDTGTLDPSFGVGGVVALAEWSTDALALQSDAILVGGPFGNTAQLPSVLRLAVDGSIEGGFGSKGVFSFGTLPGGVGNFALQPDGGIVVLAADMFRLHANGKLDTSFGVGGVAAPFPVPPGWDSAGGNRITLQRDGRIVVVGTAFAFGDPPVGDSYEVSVVRYDVDGTLDASFSPQQIAFAHATVPVDVIMQPDGKALVASVTYPQFPPPTSLFAVTRVFAFILPCPASPAVGCHASVAALAGKLRMDDRTTNPKAGFQWQWVKGTATTVGDFGDPVGGDDYTLCLYDESAGSTLTTGAVIPGGGLCKGKPCWKALGSSGISYGDSKRRRFGIGAIKLKAGAAGKAQVSIKGQGGAIPAPSLPAALPLRIQLIAENGQCWESVFSPTGTTRNDGARYQGKSD